MCGVDSQAAAWCMGSGSKGQLGIGAQDQFIYYISATPVPVAPENGSTIPFYAVSAGGWHTCGVSPRTAIGPLPSPATTTSSPTVPEVGLPTPEAAPATSPLPSPAPNLGAQSKSPSSSSSFPVGAIVGAVVGAAGKLQGRAVGFECGQVGC